MLNTLSIAELTAKLAQRATSAREVTQASLDQIQKRDGQLHAFLNHDAADARAR